jgi:transposase
LAFAPEVAVARLPKNDPKLQSLRAHGALHPHPEAVTEPDFCAGGFFDAKDFVQVKYEMLRRARVDGVSISHAAAVFGLSRVAFYKARSRFESDGLVGLLPRKRGPRRAHKLSPEVVQFLLDALQEDRTLGRSQLVELVAQRFEISVHRRSVERALERGKKRLR